MNLLRFKFGKKENQTMNQTTMNFDNSLIQPPLGGRIKDAYEKPKYDGETFDKALDQKRLDTQLERVKNLMMDGASRTLYQITKECGGSESGCAARIRDLRKERFGGYEIARTRDGNTFFYRMVGK